VEELLAERSIAVDQTHASFMHYGLMGSTQRRTRGRTRGKDQTGVDRQERLCREVAGRLGLVIASGAVFVG
jgi:hypothetical protein